MKIGFSHPVTAIKGIGDRYAQILNEHGIDTVQDLLLHFPIRWIDPRQNAGKPAPGAAGVFRIVRGPLRLSRIFRRRLSVLCMDGHCQGLPVRVVFFNKPYLKDSLQELQEIVLYGTWKKANREIPEMVNPVWIQPDRENRIIPVHPAMGPLKSGHLRRMVEAALNALDNTTEMLPASILDRSGFSAAAASFRCIHAPEDMESLPASLKRFSYTEFLLFHLELEVVRRHFRQRERGNRYRFGREWQGQVKRALSFQLTPGQVGILEDVCRDLLAPMTMSRLIQGEVGSGKTVIAFLALLAAAVNGRQGAFLAPTELLARQHHQKALPFFGEYAVALLTGSTPAGERHEILKRLKSGKISVLVGTHALLRETIRFARLSLIVIDEQHRFGVAQRAALYAKGQAVDVLATTATPIPRTLQLSLQGDLEVSLLKKEGRPFAPITTRIIPAERRDRFYSWLKKRVQGGEKGYIILPLIEGSEDLPDLRSLAGERIFFTACFGKDRWMAICGRTAASEKHLQLDRLRSGEIGVLAATTVIEVGIDIPDALFIVIENADRFGLAQLHQMRGRVGRGNQASSCFLIASTAPTPGGKKRLQAMKTTDDGFRIAEMDLSLRGPGVIAGQEQVGVADFHCADPETEPELYRQAALDAAVLLDTDDLTPALRAHINHVNRKLHRLSFS